MNSSRSLKILLLTVACGGLVSLQACSKSAESKGNAQPPAASEGAPAPSGAADDMAPTPVAPETGGAAADPGTAPTPTEAAPADKGAAAPVKDAGGAGSAGAETEFYKVDISYPSTLKAGASGVARIVITPAAGWKMNHEFPTKITVEAPADVKVTKAEQKKGDAASFTDKGASFEVPFTATAAGDKSFQAKLKFAVCTDATCDPKKEELAWVVAVK